MNNQNMVNVGLENQAPVVPTTDDLGCSLAPGMVTQEGMEGIKLFYFPKVFEMDRKTF